MTSKIGGFLGIGKTESKTTFSLEKDVYQVGDTIRVTVNCDNSSCKKDISGFKLKLIRNIQATAFEDYTDDPKHANHQKYISVFKDS